ncbi:hypothetical protein JXO52_00815 [bacterium]|nr:hypothetical protein [bacterium]
MIDLLRDLFPDGSGYVLEQREPDEIDRCCRLHLYEPSRSAARHRQWAPEAGDVSILGSRIGWVPESLPPVFFTETVEMEVAVYCAAAAARAGAGEQERIRAGMLLARMGLAHLAERQPYALSDGETKLIWFLCQLAKQPEYLIAGNPARGLSEASLQRLIGFLRLFIEDSPKTGIPAPVCILGCTAVDRDSWTDLLSFPGWIMRENPLCGDARSVL